MEMAINPEGTFARHGDVQHEIVQRPTTVELTKASHWQIFQQLKIELLALITVCLIQ
ncbi:hypothetical protein BWQ96_07059 [Gracilariopsis chorda]|uniref:Uncharacterized protein n=1 Tax=Gracilariopsis chorda TaxID=448386 RepID=A0A2V3IQ25_9FLOR|nr:hypothetical protein BWQ96_07059 [Gracilariopsis chorda]|eukprot:PXF43230.1 hypothetical protein BWQ96_07059 [Gracilariopsis chorda]